MYQLHMVDRNMQHWWNDNWKSEVLGKKFLLLWYFVRYKMHMDGPGIEPEPLQ
jgi:hypothetical protein